MSLVNVRSTYHPTHTAHLQSLFWWTFCYSLTDWGGKFHEVNGCQPIRILVTVRLEWNTLHSSKKHWNNPTQKNKQTVILNSHAQTKSKDTRELRNSPNKWHETSNTIIKRQRGKVNCKLEPEWMSRWYINNNIIVFYTYTGWQKQIPASNSKLHAQFKLYWPTSPCM